MTRSTYVNEKEMHITVRRFDLEDNPDLEELQLDLLPRRGTNSGSEYHIDRANIMTALDLPSDSIIKLYHENKVIPWCMASKSHNLEIHITRPHQNVRPRISEGPAFSEDLIQKKIKELENHITNLEAVADPNLIAEKTDRDIQLLTKQISFLAKRLEEADKAVWVKKT